MKENKVIAKLVLADGTEYTGISFGAEVSDQNPVVGEVVFNTSMYGYQEILTDPSYAGQIMTFTTAQVGNVGVNSQDYESDKLHTQAVVVKNYCSRYSNYRAEKSLGEWLKENGVPGISGIDTRSLVRHLRDNGAQMGAIATGEADTAKLQAAAKAAGTMEGKNYVKSVSTVSEYSWTQLPWQIENNHYPEVDPEGLADLPHLVALDCGIKKNILRILSGTGFRVTVMPAYSSAEEILAKNPDALFLSNGPGDPATLSEIVATVKSLVNKLPIFGICLGHQILSQALGAKTFKLKFGHRGGNHPVLDLKTNKVEITSQNHGFAVEVDSMENREAISHWNLNDQTVEGIRQPELKLFSVQYHPEASPGPQDSQYLFQEFYNLVKENRNSNA